MINSSATIKNIRKRSAPDAHHKELNRLAARKHRADVKKQDNLVWLRWVGLEIQHCNLVQNAANLEIESYDMKQKIVQKHKLGLLSF